tara:strand:+ start:3741 stop:5870 length:2130 start_codon:yes stop_codon:yes gene_type:complete
MADPVNLLESNGIVFNATKWSSTNSSIRVAAALGFQETSLGSGVGKDALLVTADSVGEVTVTSPLFAVSPTKDYSASGIITIGSAYAEKEAELKVEYFTVTAGGGGTVITPSGQKVTNGEWVASTDNHINLIKLPADATSTYPLGSPLSVHVNRNGFDKGGPVAGAARFWVPLAANYARLVFTVDAPLAAKTSFILSDVFAVDMSLLMHGVTINSTYRLLPDFIISEDANEDNETQGHLRMVKRFLSSLYSTGVTIGDELASWRYVRPTDSDTGIEEKSALTDPQQTKEAYLTWLAQLVGVTLVNPFTGLSMWLSLPGWAEASDSTTWQELDLSDDTDEAADSTSWAKVRSSSYEDLQSYRDQIEYGFNGLHAGRPVSMRGYLKTLLDTTTPDSYFHRIKRHDRESPFLVKYVYDTEVDPDPDGNRVSSEMEPTLAMGVSATQSNKPRDAAAFAFEAQDFLSVNVPGAGAAANDDTVFKFGNDACAAVPDLTGSGRHISLTSATTAIDPKDSRYGIISSARYNENFAFYPCGVSGSKVYMRAATVSTGLSGGETDADYVFLVSDINYGNSSDIILFQQGTSGTSNYRACVIDETGVLKYLTGTSGSAASTAYSSATHTQLYDFTTLGTRWIRISVTGSTTKFFVAPSLPDVCHPTNYLINSVSLSSPNVYDKTLTADFFQVNHADNGIIGYRAIVNDGTLDSSYTGSWG